MLDILVVGLVGAAASILGKVSLTSSNPLMDFIHYYCEVSLQPVHVSSNCPHILVGIRIISFAAMLYFNALMLGLFLKALEKRGSLPVTVISSATNFLLTGLLSGTLLGEKVTSRWFLGAFCIACGVCLIAVSQNNSKRTE